MPKYRATVTVDAVRDRYELEATTIAQAGVVVAAQTLNAENDGQIGSDCSRINIDLVHLDDSSTVPALGHPGETLDRS